MSRLCPRCKSNFEDRWYCPTCGVRLVSESSGSKTGTKKRDLVGEPGISKRPGSLSRLLMPMGTKWQQTTWGRWILGVLLAQGLFYGLYQMASLIVVVITDSETAVTFWQSVAGLLGKQFLQGVGIVSGGIVAGAGQRRAVRNGTVVGLYNGFLFLLMEAVLGRQNYMLFIGQPLLPAAFGTLGGYLGRIIWAPMAPMVTARLIDPESLPADKDSPDAVAGIPLPKPRFRPAGFSGGIGWVRVACGIILLVSGSLSAGGILKWMLTDQEGFQLAVESASQAKFITWEISVLAMICGGALAGANTFNGPLQGLIVGIVSSAILIGFQIADQGEAAQTLGFSVLGLQVNSLLMKILFTLLSVIPLSTVGGWFGGQLLPPVVVPRRRRKSYVGAQI